MNRHELARYWDEVVGEWLDDRDPLDTRPELRRWAGAYGGGGDGVVDRDALPEPYIGALDTPGLVLMGLNPGRSDAGFQHRHGHFAADIRRLGYTAWAATDPYASSLWTTIHGRNRYLSHRAAFARRWTGDRTLGTSALLLVELFPWHSAAVTAPMRPDPGTIREFVWEPLAEIDTEVLYAFGRPWLDVATGLGLEELPHTASFKVPSRRLRTFRLPTGQVLATMWHSGSAGPPGAPDTVVLREELAALTGR